MSHLPEPALRAAAALLGAPVEGPTLSVGEAVPDRWPEGPFGLIIASPDALPPDQRPAWWAALAQRLAPGGVAAVRLPMLPGWHPLTAVQDFARFHASRRGLTLTVALDEVFTLTRDVLGNEPGRWAGWMELVQRLRQEDPAALPNLDRAPVWPAELHTWVVEARGLTWLGDARGPNHGARRLGRALAAWVEEEGRGDPLRAAQIADYARNQHTRLGLFLRGAPGAPTLAAGLELGPPDEHPLRWAFEPPAVPYEESELPALTQALVAEIAGTWTPLSALRAPQDQLLEAIRAGWEAGALTLRA
jgi:hypothetical protein